MREKGGRLERELIWRFVTRYRGSLRSVVIASLVLNALVFAGSIYMLLVYDSVLPSGSVPTLAGLFVMLVAVYLFQALFETIRGEAMLAVANGVQRDLFVPIHRAAVARSLQGGRDAQQLTRDLDLVHGFLAGAGPVALFDLPWVIVFLVVLSALHWSLGLAALFGAIVLAGIAWETARRSTAGTHRMLEITGRRLAATQAELRFAEAARAMGMQGRLLARSAACDAEHVEAQSYLSRTVARLGGAGRTFRVFVQSLILTVGALLVIDGKASGGIIIAASVLSGRMLAPVDLAIANWRGLAAAREGWSRIVDALSAHPAPDAPQVALGRPSGELDVRDLWVAPPGTQTAVLSGVSLSVRPGEALAIIGPSAAGKTSLAKAILGIWKPARGDVRLDGATYDQWSPDILGAAIGYVPQVVELIDGTLAQNIARFDPDAPSEAIVAAARAAGFHDAIVALPRGYETPVSVGGPEFSAGQRQRIGLARALYGDPHLVVLDEPNSNLDAAGDEALARAIEGVRARNGIVVMITHRPATLRSVSHVAVLQGGRIVDHGEREPLLQRLNGPSISVVEAVPAKALEGTAS